MSDFEVLKECKVAYDILEDLRDNCTLINDEDDDTYDSIENTMEILSDLYSNAWELIASNKDTYKQLETNLVDRFGHSVVISDLIDYAYLCKECDENQYSIECDLKQYKYEDFDTLEQAYNKYKEICGKVREDIEEELNSKDENIVVCNELIKDMIEEINGEIKHKEKLQWWLKEKESGIMNKEINGNDLMEYYKKARKYCKEKGYTLMSADLCGFNYEDNNGVRNNKTWAKFNEERGE